MRREIMLTRFPIPFVLLTTTISCSRAETNTARCHDGVRGNTEDTGSDHRGSDLSAGDTDDTGQDEATDDTGATTDEPALPDYCEGNDAALANCDADRNYDPWIAHGGEVHYWIRDRKTETFPFTVMHEPQIWYGYLQMTSPEVQRDPYTEDVFHAWFSETPNGPVLNGDSRCERYSRAAELNFYWHQREGDEQLAEACFIGTQARVLYLNYETRCIPSHYEGVCDDDNKQKSDETYQFDVARRRKLLD